MTLTVASPTELHVNEKKERLRRETQEILDACGWHLTGHFDLGGGRHSRDYFNPHALLRRPSIIWQLAQLMIDAAPSVATQAPIIVAPITGGAILGHTIAGLLDAQRSLGESAKYFIPVKEIGHEFVIQRSYSRLLSGAKVWLVDDTVRTGRTKVNITAQLEVFGAEVVATSAIAEARGAIHDRSVRERPIQRSSLVELPPTREYVAGTCPMCAAGEDVTEF